MPCGQSTLQNAKQKALSHERLRAILEPAVIDQLLIVLILSLTKTDPAVGGCLPASAWNGKMLFQPFVLEHMKRKESRSWLCSQRSLHVLFCLDGMLGMSQQLVSWSDVAQPELTAHYCLSACTGCSARHFLPSCQLWRGYPLRKRPTAAVEALKGMFFSRGIQILKRPAAVKLRAF